MNFRKTKRETMEEFKARLRRVALSVSENKVKKAVGSMVRRCATISAAAGDLFHRVRSRSFCTERASWPSSSRSCVDVSMHFIVATRSGNKQKNRSSLWHVLLTSVLVGNFWATDCFEFGPSRFKSSRATGCFASGPLKLKSSRATDCFEAGPSRFKSSRATDCFESGPSRLKPSHAFKDAAPESQTSVKQKGHAFDDAVPESQPTVKQYYQNESDTRQLQWVR